MRRRGFSLIEAAIVLGIVGLVVAGIWVAAAAVQRSYKQAKLQEDLGFFFQNIKNDLHQTAANPGTSNYSMTDYLFAKKSVPGGWAYTGGYYFTSPYSSAQNGSPYSMQVGRYESGHGFSPNVIWAVFSNVDPVFCSAISQTIRKLWKKCIAASGVPTLSQLSGDTVHVEANLSDGGGGYYVLDLCTPAGTLSCYDTIPPSYTFTHIGLNFLP